MTMMQTMTLTEFLLARIAEDEAESATDCPCGFCDDTRAPEWYTARVLAECEAKRRIVEQANLYLCDSGPGCGYRTKHGHSVLRIIALPYADHPDYLPEWKP